MKQGGQKLAFKIAIYVAKIKIDGSFIEHKIWHAIVEIDRKSQK